MIKYSGSALEKTNTECLTLYKLAVEIFFQAIRIHIFHSLVSMESIILYAYLCEY